MSTIAASCASSDRQHEPHYDIRSLPAHSLRLGCTLKDRLERHRLLRFHLRLGRLDIPVLHHLIELRVQDDLHHRHVFALFSQVDNIPAQYKRAFIVFKSLHPVENQSLTGNRRGSTHQGISRRSRRPAPHDRSLQGNKQNKKNKKHGPGNAIPRKYVPQRRPLAHDGRGNENLLLWQRLDSIRYFFSGGRG